MIVRTAKKSQIHCSVNEGDNYKKKGLSANVLVLAALVFLLIVGFWLRINNLGLLGLIGDEGHQALAVDGILKYGYPLVPSGGVYLRSILYLYTQSVSALVFGLNEFSLRLPSVLFNLGSIVMIYLFGCALFNAKVGLLSAIILTFSAWEIELSRYGRMYTAFQLLYLCSLFTFYKGFIRGKKIYQFLVPPTFILAFIFHDLGLTLLMVFFVPFFIESYGVVKKKVLFLYMVLIAGGFYAYRKGLSFMVSTMNLATIKGRSFEDRINSLVAIENFIKKHFDLPAIGLLKQLYSHHYWVFFLICTILVITLGCLIYRAYITDSKKAQNVLAMPIIISCFLYQFTLAFLLFCLYVLLFYKDVRTLKDPSLILIYLSAVFFFLFWFTYASLYPVSHPYFSLSEAFWGYPNFYRYFPSWFIEGWPIFTVITGMTIILMAYVYLKDRTSIPYVFCVLGCLLPTIFASFMYAPFYESRYTFHMYPLLILIFSFSLVTISGYISRKAATLARGIYKEQRFQKVIGVLIAVLLAVILSQDIYPSEVLAISRRTYKTVRNPNKAITNMQPYASYHQDYRTPARFLTEHMHTDDIIILMAKAHVPSIYHYYIGKVDYILTKNPRDYGEYCDGRLIHYMTGSVGITNSNTLKQVIEKNRERRIWLLTDFYLLDHYYSPDMRRTVKTLAGKLMYTGQDGKTFVYLIDSSRADLQG